MREEDLIYSFSNGSKWSKYNHCKTWNNGLHTIIVKDKYDQTTTTTVEITNNHKNTVAIPIIDTDTYVEGNWSSSDVLITITNLQQSIKYSVDGGINWTTTINNSFTASNTSNWAFKNVDQYGNESEISTITINIDSSAPTNLNFTPLIIPGGQIRTVVTAIDSDSPLKYSISYDGGAWSTPQIGGKFGWRNIPVGAHTINCRAYNAAGLYIIGTPVSITIT
jgi:hypothetical protein